LVFPAQSSPAKCLLAEGWLNYLIARFLEHAAQK
jgi:hypothetical protein